MTRGGSRSAVAVMGPVAVRKTSNVLCAILEWDGLASVVVGEIRSPRADRETVAASSARCGFRSVERTQRQDAAERLDKACVVAVAIRRNDRPRDRSRERSYAAAIGDKSMADIVAWLATSRHTVSRKHGQAATRDGTPLSSRSQHPARTVETWPWTAVPRRRLALTSARASKTRRAAQCLERGTIHATSSNSDNFSPTPSLQALWRTDSRHRSRID